MTVKKLKSISIMFCLFLLIQSCATNKHSVYWVSGVKTDCSAGAGKMQCLNVYKGEKLENAQWQNFYAPIQGFVFEQGILKKIKVKEEKLDPKTVPADASSIKYTLVKVLEQTADKQAMLGGSWTLVKHQDQPLNRMVAVPTLEINTGAKRISGNGGCNEYTAEIKNVTQSKIEIGAVAGTRKACIGKNIENQYYAALEKISTYQADEKTLTFYDAENKALLSFIKNEKEQANIRLHDIWVAVRINGNPINRMSPTPRLEIDINKKHVMGNNGCNDFHGNIDEITATQLLFGNIAVTQKICPKMETADAFDKAMNQVAAYRLDGLKLLLLNKEGREVLAFQKAD